jgi:hypothetical protein
VPSADIAAHIALVQPRIDRPAAAPGRSSEPPKVMPPASVVPFDDAELARGASDGTATRSSLNTTRTGDETSPTFMAQPRTMSTRSTLRPHAWVTAVCGTAANPPHTHTYAHTHARTPPTHPPLPRRFTTTNGTHIELKWLEGLAKSRGGLAQELVSWGPMCETFCGRAHHRPAGRPPTHACPHGAPPARRVTHVCAPACAPRGRLRL